MENLVLLISYCSESSFILFERILFLLHDAEFIFCCEFFIKLFNRIYFFVLFYFLILYILRLLILKILLTITFILYQYPILARVHPRPSRWFLPNNLFFIFFGLIFYNK
jgi:hypothetical protein